MNLTCQIKFTITPKHINPAPKYLKKFTGSLKKIASTIIISIKMLLVDKKANSKETSERAMIQTKTLTKLQP